MTRYLGKWRIGLYLNQVGEIECATVDVRDELGVREIVKCKTGPFDTPEEIMGLLIELIQAAEWRGQQLTLLGTSGEQQIYDGGHECPATELDQESISAKYCSLSPRGFRLRRRSR